MEDDGPEDFEEKGTLPVLPVTSFLFCTSLCVSSRREITF